MSSLVNSMAVQQAGLGKITLKNHRVVSLGGVIQLACGRTHEVMGDAADMFAIATAMHMVGPVLWIGCHNHVRSLAPTGLQDFLSPARIITTSCISRQEVLWAAEQSLRMLKNGCVVTALDDGPNLTESRRLQIAAEEGNALGIILIAKRAQTSAAQTRWVCDALPDQEIAWVWRLTKDKGGQVGTWKVGWRAYNGENKDGPNLIFMAATAAA